MSKPVYNPWKVDVLAVTLMLGVSIGAWLSLRPTLTRSADESRAQASLVKERRNASELSRTLAMAQTELRRTRRELDAYTQSCWNDTDRSRRIEGLYVLARGDGIKVDGIEPGEPEMTSGRRGLSLRMTGRGTFAALTKTLEGLRAGNPDMVARSVEIIPAPNSDNEVDVTVEILWVWPSEALPKDPVTPAPTAAVR